MGAPRLRSEIAWAMQRELHCDLGGVSTCANDVLHSTPPTAKERTHDASAEDCARDSVPKFASHSHHLNLASGPASR